MHIKRFMRYALVGMTAVVLPSASADATTSPAITATSIAGAKLASAKLSNTRLLGAPFRYQAAGQKEIPTGFQHPDHYTRPSEQPFVVRSTLDGKSVLPHRIRWIANPRLPAAKVDSVEFLIDGKMRWIEHKPAYTYGGLDWNGYLVTSWLTPGRHRFTVLVTARDGRSATDTVTARVVAAPRPPAALAGTWQRTIDTSTAPRPGSPGNPTNTFTPSGNYRMTFEKRWIRDSFPGKFVLPQSNNTGNGFIFLDDYTAAASRLHVAGEVLFHPYSESRAEGGWWCYPDGPPANYDWSVSGSTLTLTPVGGADTCGIRGFIWTGQWTKVG